MEDSVRDGLGMNSVEPAKSAGGQCWFAAHLRPNAERLAEENLRRQGFACFFPRRIKTVRHARQFRTSHAPLFPCYGFVSLDLARDRWRSVNGTLGVVSLVMTGGEPRQVPAGIVEALQDLSAADGVIRFDHGLKEGQRVKLLAGPFADMLGTLEQLDDQGRVHVLLEMMGSYVRITSSARQLAPA